MKPFAFRRLRTRLTVLYAALFGVMLILVSLAVQAAVTANAERIVRGELQASGTVFDRLWALRAQQLEDGGALLAQDFGFRAAIASHDESTVRSALENLRGRLGVERAMIVGLDGSVITSDGKPAGLDGGKLVGKLDGQAASSGVATVGDVAYQAVAAPILMPDPQGWVVFSSRLDERQMAVLERLSAIPLKASVVVRPRVDAGDKGLRGLSVDARRREVLIRHALAAGSTGAQRLDTQAGPSIALVKTLDTLAADNQASLLLTYPLAQALGPFRQLIGLVIGIGVLGGVMVIAGAWFLARGITRPISELEAAAQRLQDGGEAEVEVDVASHDEIGRLAQSFNLMASTIREREARITHLALHDPDTGLANRVALEQSIAQMLKEGGAPCVAVAAFGIDRFQDMRGAIGYAMASRLVGEVGRRMAALDPRIQAARLSTETLGVVFRSEHVPAARRTAMRIAEALGAPLDLDGATVDVSLTVGLAGSPDHGDSFADLIERASIALDQARSSRQSLAVYDRVAYGDPAANLNLMSDMRVAMTTGDFTLNYQPKYDLRQGRTTGVEALARWRHPKRGPLSPDLFVTMAEETGHIREMTEWVLDRALADQAIMTADGRPMEMSVNLSGRLLGDSDFISLVIDRARHAAAPFCLEVTETAVIDDPLCAMENTERMAMAGLKVSIDDYGSGLSSLAYLRQMHAHELKIDKAFVLKMDESRRDALLVRSTVDLAHSLGMKVTAEGVETYMALSLLMGMGCDMAQGFGIARPMTLEKLIPFLRPAPDSAGETKKPRPKLDPPKLVRNRG